MSRKIEENSSVAFLMQDGSKTKQIVNEQFLFTQQGRRKSSIEIANDLKAIASDLNAKYILI